MCAAPGGKTTFIAQLMRNEGRIVACDVSAGRLKLVEENCARLGAPPIPEKPTEFTLLPGTPYFVFTLKVFGHTPCRILNVGLRFHREFLKEGIIAEEPNLPEEPVYW